MRLGTYVVGHDRERLAAVLAGLRRVWGDSLPAQTLVGVAPPALPEMLCEVDAVAVRPVPAAQGPAFEAAPDAPAGPR
ncbi:hypothetical protein GCM10009802_14470 [Streptomyces synnematoformans]|uniref:Uncharacterized protein n=1 Tax=Streptomyces synnematoformans TaxID=415721 RepID=A0ABN2XNV9_9ACTN